MLVIRKFEIKRIEEELMKQLFIRPMNGDISG